MSNINACFEYLDEVEFQICQRYELCLTFCHDNQFIDICQNYTDYIDYCTDYEKMEENLNRQSDCCPFAVFGGLDNGLALALKVGTGMTYVSILFNIVIFLSFTSRTLLSPATIIMQGLALADGLTSICSYGLEPLFQTVKFDLNITDDNLHPYQYAEFTMDYPYCGVYVYMSYSVDMFHLISVLLTTCLGIQKVIAVQFPIWTRIYLTRKKAIICCLFMFFVSIAIHIPKLLAVVFESESTFLGSDCVVRERNGNLTVYLFVYYQIFMAGILLSLFIIMILCSSIIIYKLSVNTFGHRKRIWKREKRSIVLTILILVLLIITDTPRMILYGTIFFNTSWRNGLIQNSHMNTHLLGDYRSLLTNFVIITYGSEFLIDKQSEIRLGIEGINLFTLVGCLSNFIIYIIMSSKLRRQLKRQLLCSKVNRNETIKYQGSE